MGSNEIMRRGAGVPIQKCQTTSVTSLKSHLIKIQIIQLRV